MRFHIIWIPRSLYLFCAYNYSGPRTNYVKMMPVRIPSRSSRTIAIEYRRYSSRPWRLSPAVGLYTVSKLIKGKVNQSSLTAIGWSQSFSLTTGRRYFSDFPRRYQFSWLRTAYSKLSKSDHVHPF